MDTFGGARLASPLLPMARCWLPMTARSPSGGLATQESELCVAVIDFCKTFRTDGRNFRLLTQAEHHYAVGGHRHRVLRPIWRAVAVCPRLSYTGGRRFHAQGR